MTTSVFGGGGGGGWTQKTKTVTFATISPRMVNPRDIAGKAEEDQEEENCGQHSVEVGDVGCCSVITKCLATVTYLASLCSYTPTHKQHAGAYRVYFCYFHLGGRV